LYALEPAFTPDVTSSVGNASSGDVVVGDVCSGRAGVADIAAVVDGVVAAEGNGVPPHDTANTATAPAVIRMLTRRHIG
jgi:hypothetical protein